MPVFHPENSTIFQRNADECLSLSKINAFLSLSLSLMLSLILSLFHWGARSRRKFAHNAAKFRYKLKQGW